MYSYFVALFPVAIIVGIVVGAGIVVVVRRGVAAFLPSVVVAVAAVALLTVVISKVFWSEIVDESVNVA